MAKLVLVPAALPFPLMPMHGFQSRGSVCPGSLCDVPGRCVVWLESCGSHTEPVRAWDSLYPFSTVLDAGKLARRPQKSPQKQLEEGSEPLWHTHQWHTLLTTSLKMNHCRGWDMSRGVLNQELLEQFWFPRWVCINLCQWLLLQQAYQAFRWIFFPVEENIQSSRDSEAG